MQRRLGTVSYVLLAASEKYALEGRRRPPHRERVAGRDRRSIDEHAESCATRGPSVRAGAEPDT